VSLKRSFSPGLLERSRNGQGAAIEIDVRPSQREDLAPAHSGCDRKDDGSVRAVPSEFLDERKYHAFIE